MSGIFGVFNRNRAPVNPAELAGMHAIYAQWFDEDRGQWIDGNIGLGHTMQWNTPESSLEKLPAEQGERGSRLVITSHTRLDNRKELIGKLNIRKPIESVADSELILAGYQKWREECPRHLLGDFAFAIWDERSNRLYCARDHMGIQPLFYRTVNSQLAFANNIEPLVQGCFSPPQLKQETIARYLRDGENYSATDTFFEGVFQLPPGSYLIADAAGVTVSQYWSLQEVPPLTLGSIDEYSEMLLELLRDSVRCRLRSQHRTGAHLSGGLDSSAIVACAGAMGLGDLTGLTTFSWMHPPASEEEFVSPEWSLGREIAETYRLPHVYTEFSSEDYLNLLYNHDIAMGDTVDVWAEKPLARNAAAMGIRTMLSGWGGDQLITHYGNDVYAERVMRGQVIASFWELLKTCRPRSKFMILYPQSVYRCIVQPLLRAYTPPFSSDYCEQSFKYLDYASPRLRAVAAQQEKLLFYNSIYLRIQQLCSARLAHLHNRVNSWAVSGQKLGLGYSYPLLDKRVVEMAVAVPFELYRKNDIPRYLFKRTMREHEPVGFWGQNQKYEPYRVARVLARSVDGLRAWAHNRQPSEGAGRFIDERRLISEIDELEFHKVADNPEMAHKVMVINRSILVLGLDRYL